MAKHIYGNQDFEGDNIYEIPDYVIEMTPIESNYITTASAENILQVHKETWQSRSSRFGFTLGIISIIIALCGLALTLFVLVKYQKGISQEPRPAFHAHGSGGRYLYSHHEKIRYPVTILNIGNHYNPTTSTFTCPVDGVYIFMYSLYSGYIKNGEHYSGSLVVNGIWQASIYNLNNDPDHYIQLQSSQTVVTECPTGATVYVRSNTHNNTMYDSEKIVFSGVLLDLL